MSFTDLFGHAMTVGEHVAETQNDRPAEQHVHERAAGPFHMLYAARPTGLLPRGVPPARRSRCHPFRRSVAPAGTLATTTRGHRRVRGTETPRLPVHQ